VKRIAELSLFSICISMAAVSPSRAQDWLYRARIAGTEMDIEMSNAEIFNVLDELRAQRVSVVEAETLLGNHLTPAAFDSEIVFITRVALYAQQLGL